MGKHAKSINAMGGKKGASVIKHSNKKYSKLLKRGKKKNPTVTKFNKGASGNFLPLKSKGENKKKLANGKSNKLRINENGKRSLENDASDEEDGSNFENQPRRFEAYKNAKKLKTMLPIKDKSGLIQQYMNVEAHIEDNCAPANKDNVDAEENSPPKKKLNTFSIKSLEKRVASCKLRIASLATLILEDPVSKLKSLTELRSMLDDTDSPILFIQQKLVLVSLLEVYKDIIPSYKIRSLKEQEKDQQMKADTKQLQDYEFSLLKGYKEYLQRLEALAAVWIKSKNVEKLFPKKNLSLDKILKLGEISVKCLCELLVTHPHFNLANNILVAIVPFAASKHENIAVLCCNTLKMLYKHDKLGAISLEGVRQTSKIVKDKSYNINPKVLETFLYLKIKDIKLQDIVDERAKKLTHKEKMQTMSRREYKKNKKMQKLESELQETAAEESKKKKMTHQTDIIKQIFLSYFNVLKKAPNSKLLGSVLEGLAKFAHLINIEFFDDLIFILHHILEKKILDVRQSFLCISTVFTILSGQGAALNIDPLRFYTQCYKNMFTCNLISEDSDLVPLLVACLDMMINKRKKQVSLPRVFAFAHRSCIVALQSNHHSAISLLSIIRSFIQNFPRLDVLLDGETGQANGSFLPELDDPEHCNAGSSSLWGIQLLKSHYHPTVAKFASHISVSCPISGDGQLPLDLARKSAIELFDEYNPQEIADFYPSLTKLKDNKSTRRIKMKQKHWKPVYSDLHEKMNGEMEKIELNSFQISGLNLKQT